MSFYIAPVAFSSITGTALDFTLQPKAPTVTQTAGTLFLKGSNAAKANGNGGAVSLTAGDALGLGVGGSFNFNGGGSTSGSGGSVVLTGGTSVVGGGNVNILGGISGGVAQVGGADSATILGSAGYGKIFGGNSGNAGGGSITAEGGFSGVGGNVVLQAGTGDGSGFGANRASGDAITRPGAGDGGFTLVGSSRIQTSLGDDGLRVTDDGVSVKLAFYGVTPVLRPATGGSSSTFVANVSANFLYTGSTFDGYTLAQVVRALKNLGLLT